MAISLTNFTNLANKVGANSNTAIRLQENEQLSSSSSIFGSFRGHAQANTRTAQAFLEEIQNSSEYAPHIGIAREKILSSLEDGKPLTARTITKTMQALDQQRLEVSILLGNELAQSGPLPAGHGTSFALFCAQKGDYPTTTDDPKLAENVREYLAKNIFPEFVSKQLSAADLTDQNGDAGRLPQILNRLQKQLLEQAVGENLDKNFDQTQTALENALQPFLNALKGLRDPEPCEPKNERLFNELASDKNHSSTILNILANARASEVITNEGYGLFYQNLLANRALLENPDVHIAGQQAIQEFLLNPQEATAEVPMLAKKLLEKHDLPANLTMPLLHHPEVVASAKAALNKIPGIPNKEQINQTLTHAFDTFLKERVDDIKECVDMAKNPPVNLTSEPLTLENLPVFINAMLSEKTLVDSFVDGSISKNPNRIEILRNHTHILQSCAHGTSGEYGKDDINAVGSGAMQLFLAKKGVLENTEQLHQVLNSILSLGQMGAELLSVAEFCSAKELAGGNILQLQNDAMGVYDSLLTRLTTILDAMPENTLGPIEGDTQLEKLENLIKHNFNQKVTKNFSGAVLRFTKSYGVSVQSDLTNHPLLQKQKNFFPVLYEFFPDAGHSIQNNTKAFLKAFASAAQQHHDLQEIAPQSIKSITMQKAAANACEQWLKAHPNQIALKEDLRKIIANSLTQSFLELKDALDSVETMNNAFGQPLSGEQKSVAKKIFLNTDLRNPELIRKTVLESNSSLEQMAREQNTQVNIGEHIVELAKTYFSLSQKLSEEMRAAGEDSILLDDLLPAFVLSSRELSNLSKDQQTFLFNTMNGDVGNDVGRVFNLLLNIRHDSQLIIGCSLAATRIMDELRHQLSSELDIDLEIESLHFTKTREATPCEIDNLVMSAINNNFSADKNPVFSEIEVALAKMRPALNNEQFNALEALGNRLAEATPDNYQLDLPNLIMSNSKPLLKALEKNGGKLTDSQFWNAMTGYDMAPSLIEQHGGLSGLIQFMEETYTKALKTAAPNQSDPQRNMAIHTNFASGVPFSKLMQLIYPHGRLTKDDISQSLNMSSLAGYGPENAYGLTTDFRRRSKESIMTFAPLNGDILQTNPFHIPDNENKPSHEHFQLLMEKANSMSQSPAQKARILQAFSQAGVIFARMISDVFPGVTLSEHGNFSVKAQQQEGGNVVVDIVSDPSLPLHFEQQYVIEPNGDHECTKFIMER